MAGKYPTLITSLTWGSIELTAGGQSHHFRDGKIWPGGGREWDWRETGTAHKPGIQPADLQEILEKGVEVIVLGRGVFNRLQVQPVTEALLCSRRIEYHVLNTREAVALFNDLVKMGRRTGGLFHTTC